MNKTDSAQILFSQLPTQNILLMLGVAIIPLLALAMTSYIKVSIIFSILRSTFGVGQIPTNTVSGILTLLISIYTVEPLIKDSFNIYETNQKLSNYNRIVDSLKPFIEFTSKNTNEVEKKFFAELECKRKLKVSICPADYVPEEQFTLKLLAFISSELRSAFNLGLKVCIPFLIIDLVVSTLLTALGMMMVSPVTITFPLKLLLFILSDGWSLLISHLVNSYQI